MRNDEQSYFDKYVSNYEDLVSNQTDFFSKDRGYLSKHKANILQRVWKGCAYQPEKILEFGCGIGLNLPFIADAFPKSKIFGTDISKKSLDKIRKEQKSIFCIDDNDLDRHAFDLILVSCVFHHILPQERNIILQRIQSLLNYNGVLCIIEHNPYNPITRYLVNTCPFDEDAVLLTMNETNKMIDGCVGLGIQRRGYCLFFPERMKYLNAMEYALKYIPLGGQYFVSACRV